MISTHNKHTTVKETYTTDRCTHKHNIENHKGKLEPSDFVMTVTGVYGGDATKRQIAEAIRIQHNRVPNF